MKRSPVILIDLDDTMEHFVEPWCEWLNKKYGTNVHAEDITSWRVCDFFPSLTEEQVYEPTHCDDFWVTVKPKDGAQKYIKMMMDEGMEVYICTASDYRTLKAKFKHIIERYFPFISWNQIIITKNKQMITGDVLIDDGIHNLEGGRYQKILMSVPHNMSYDAESNGMTRVNNWEQVYEVVHRYCDYIINEGKQMKVIKRSGTEADFSREKIHKAITRANDEVKAENKKYAASDETIDLIATRLYERCRKRPRATPVEEIQDMIETELMKEGAYETAKRYIRWRCRLKREDDE